MNILLLEDNSTDADLTRRGLIGSIPGCMVAIAQTLKQGKEILEQSAPFDIALLDMKLPDDTGMDLLLEIRHSKPDLPVIILTGSGHEEVAVAALKAGADDYMIKRQGYISKLPGAIDYIIKNHKQNTVLMSEIIEVLYIGHHLSDIDFTVRHFNQYAPNIHFTSISSAEEALTLIPLDEKGICPFHVILLDYRQPGLNALEFTKIVRQERKLQIPIILVTSHENEEVAIQALKLGVTEYLVKRENYLFRLPSMILNAHHHHGFFNKQGTLAKSESKYRLLADISNEIRTPMNGILGFAGLLKEPGLTGEEQQDYIKIIEKSGARMLNIINDIVDISKIESGLMELNLAELNINEQIEYTCNLFNSEVERKGLQLHFKNSLTDTKAIIKTDREKFLAILSNLVKNAIKYTHKGSIEIGYKIVETQGLASLQFYVKDTGIGIPKNRQEAIFERFIQADIVDKLAYQGTGLGLSISKAYVEILGGKIWVESEPGKGSIFYFTLPYEGKQQEETALADVGMLEVAVSQIKKLNVLIAEDDQPSEMLISIALKSISSKLFKASNGAEAVEICRNTPNIDLILMDIQMPVMNGYEATKQIRKFNKEVIIIAQTAFGQTGDRAKAIMAGCNDYISKPLNISALKNLIRRYFD